MSDELQHYPDNVKEAIEADGHHRECEPIVFSNCTVPVCWLIRMANSKATLAVKGTSVNIAGVGDKFRYGELYFTNKYHVFRDPATGRPKLRLTVKNTQDEEQTMELGDSVGLVEVEVDTLVGSYQDLLRSSDNVRLTRLRDAFSAWHKKLPDFKVGDIVKFKKGLYNNGTDPDNYYVIMALGSEEPSVKERLFEKTLLSMERHGYIEPFDCVLGSLDNEGDLVFTPATTNRLELPPSSDEVVEEKHGLPAED